MEKEIVEAFVNNLVQHIVITRRKPTKCPDCGVQIERDWFISVNGKVLKATDTTTIVEDLDGGMITIRNEDIRTIEPYRSDMAKRNRNHSRRFS